jgi:hypothetical protein
MPQTKRRVWIKTKNDAATAIPLGAIVYCWQRLPVICGQPGAACLGVDVGRHASRVSVGIVLFNSEEVQSTHYGINVQW